MKRACVIPRERARSIACREPEMPPGDRSRYPRKRSGMFTPNGRARSRSTRRVEPGRRTRVRGARALRGAVDPGAGSPDAVCAKTRPTQSRRRIAPRLADFIVDDSRSADHPTFGGLPPSLATQPASCRKPTPREIDTGYGHSPRVNHAFTGFGEVESGKYG